MALVNKWLEFKFIISAGLGLINGTDKIPSYQMTIGKDGTHSLFNFNLQDIKLDIWWNKVTTRLKTNPTCLNKEFQNYDYVIASITAPYLLMVYKDLLKLKEKLLLITGNKALAKSLGFEKNILPYNEALDGKDSYIRGIKRDFAHRAHQDFLSRLIKKLDYYAKYKNIENSKIIFEIIKEIKGDMDSWEKPILPKNKKFNDEFIVDTIKKTFKNFPGYKNLLQHFRKNLGIACEEKRFRKLYFDTIEQRLDF